MDYACPEKRKNKRDFKKKRQFRAYKRGGQLRTINVPGKEGK